MDWFKILLLVHLGLGLIFQLAYTAGYEPAERKQWRHAFSVFAWGFLFVGTLLWVVISR